MKENNIIRDKTYQFSLKIISCYKKLQENKREYTLSRQLLRSGTSIGANIIEAKSGSSTKDFRNFYTIALKSANETKYWLCLIRDTILINEKENIGKLINEADELSKIIASIIINLKK